MAPSRSDWPGAYHPEFGLLVPSPRRRGTLRLIAAGVVATVAVGTTMGLAGTHRPDRDAPAAPTIATEELDYPKTSAPAVDFAPFATGGQNFCNSVSAQDPVAAFLHPDCNAPKLRHGRHGANKARPNLGRAG